MLIQKQFRVVSCFTPGIEYGRMDCIEVEEIISVKIKYSPMLEDIFDS